MDVTLSRASSDSHLMVVILCPHCSRKVELADGSPGRFDCPHCEEEFQWGEMDEDSDQSIFTWLDWAASTIYLQIGLLFILVPVTLFYPDLLGIFSVCLFVPLISWRYRRTRRMWRTSQDLATEILTELGYSEHD